MNWFVVWLSFAVVMFFLIIVSDATPEVVGLCFFAWCGGVVSTYTYQAFQTFRRTKI